MALYVDSLLGKRSQCGADARFLLEVMALGLGHSLGSSQEFEVKALAKLLHVDERVVSSAFSELVNAGVLNRHVTPRVGRGGRASVSFKLSQQAAELLGAISQPYRHHSELLRALFSGSDFVLPVLVGKSQADESGVERGARQPLKATGRLSIRNRLLLAALLSRSDRFGEVQVSHPELALCTGMTAEKVKNRLHRLMSLGLIRRHVPGLSSSIFVAGRVSSTYFLNIDVLKSQGAIAVHIAHDLEATSFSHADRLHAEVRSNDKKNGLIKLTAPVSVLRFFSGQKRAVFTQLQHLLNRYASRLLTLYWQSLIDEAPVDDVELRGQVNADLRRPEPAGKCEVAVGPRREACVDFGQVCEYVYSLAVEVAREYRARFGQADWVVFSDAEIRILPTADDLGYRAITIMIRPALMGLNRFAVLHETTPGVSNIWPAKGEAELDLRNRLDFGLVTLPLRARKALSQ